MGFLFLSFSVALWCFQTSSLCIGRHLPMLGSLSFTTTLRVGSIYAHNTGIGRCKIMGVRTHHYSIFSTNIRYNLSTIWVALQIYFQLVLPLVKETTASLRGTPSSEVQLRTHDPKAMSSNPVLCLEQGTITCSSQPRRINVTWSRGMSHMSAIFNFDFEGYKRINIYGKMIIKRGKKDLKLCTWNTHSVRNSNSPAEWSRQRVSTHHRHHAPGTVPNGKEKNTRLVKQMNMTRGDVSLCWRIYGRA